MSHVSFYRGVFALSVVALIGAGCPSVVPSRAVQPKPASVGAKQGFGKLPTLATLNAVNPSALSSSFAEPPSAPLAEKDQAAGSAVSGSGAALPSSPTMVRPVPYPYPYPQPHPVTVEYLLEGTLPSWGAEGDVLQAVKLSADPSTLAAIGTRAGVPSVLMSGVAQITTFNAQWLDADKIQWGLDSGSHSLYFWKNDPYTQPEWKTFPTFSKEELTGIAKAFLLAHGFSALASQTPDIQEWPQILPMMGKSVQADSTGMPCRYFEGGGVMMKGAVSPQALGTDTVSADAAAPSPGIAISENAYPYPCGGWISQVTLTYPATREGKAVTDAYGNPTSNATISISLISKEATNGSMQLEEGSARSAYPLIDADTAKRRLQSGGRNPVYGYGDKNIVVHLKTVELVWMRYGSWKDGVVETYDLPALLARGTVDRGIKGQLPEEYRTIVPLLKDDVFAPDEGGVPVPILEGSTGSGSGGAVQILPAPAQAPTPLK